MRAPVLVTAEAADLSFVTGFLADLFHLDTVGLTAGVSLADDLGLDSLSMVEIIIEFENLFGIEIPNTETLKLCRVSDLMALYARRNCFLLA